MSLSKRVIPLLSLLVLLCACTVTLETERGAVEVGPDGINEVKGTEEKKEQEEQEEEMDAESLEEPSAVEDAGGAGGSEVEANIMMVPVPEVINIIATNWAFSPSAISVSQGQDVTLRITGDEGVHGFAVKGLGINMGVNPGDTIEVDLPTDTPGTYEYFCSVPCGSGHKEMTGVITIQ